MKRSKTSIANVVRYPNGDLYYRKGSIEQPLETRDEREALVAKQIIEAQTKAFGVSAFKFRVVDLLPKYLKYAEQAGYRPRSLKEINEIWEVHLKRFFGKKRLATIDEFLWNQYTSLGDVNDYANHRKVFNLFLKWCRENRFYYGRPEFSIPSHKRRRRRILTQDQIRLVFKHANGGFLIFCILTLLHSMRTGEVIKLKLEDIDLVNAHLYIRDENEKRNKGRPVPLNAVAVLAINSFIRCLRDKGIRSAFLFPNARDPKRHMSPTGFMTPWRTVQSKAEGALDGYTWHDFRATYEKFSHSNRDFTDTQKEKFSGASMDIQKRIYVSMTADDLRGLENAVKVEGLDDLIFTKIHRDSQKG